MELSNPVVYSNVGIYLAIGDVAATIGILRYAPRIRRVFLRVALMAAYASSNAVYALWAVEVGRDWSMELAFLAGASVMVALKVAYLIASVTVAGAERGLPPETPSDGPLHHTATVNRYVPAKPPAPRRYRSARRRLTNTISLWRPQRAQK